MQNKSNTQQAHFIDDKAFLEYASKLRRDTGDSIEIVGMLYETKKISINIYGELHSNYAMNIDESLMNVKGTWRQIVFSSNQQKALKALLEKEIQLVEGDIKEQERKESINAQATEDFHKYGHEGNIY